MRYQEEINFHKNTYCICMWGHLDQSEGTAHSQNMGCTQDRRGQKQRRIVMDNLPED